MLAVPRLEGAEGVELAERAEEREERAEDGEPRLRAAVGIQFDPQVVDKFPECLAVYELRADRSLDLEFLENLRPPVH